MDTVSQKQDSFEATKVRINNAFDHLKKEMQEIQRQDIVLFKELMYIRHIILLLSNYPDRRSYSISALDPSAQNQTSSLDVAGCRRPSLTRVRSAPLERNVSEDTIPEEDEDDDLAQSFNSSVSDTPQSVAVDRPSPETDFIYALSPLPPVFKKLLQSSAGELFETMDPLSESQNLLTHLNKAYSPITPCTHYDNPLHEYVTKRKLLQRQKSIDEQDTLLTESVAG
ncbi:hypothetical protein LSH36_257g03076 [Paralvinella palmiformis]|uniref:Uncharacterized protein n=1 Tax=Paralvinella palmiformis TaxID=53620 RepID=A0AAD9JKB0_9ANNE|nr:hypothetical protein LSH36_257g03076 [Paralvinella palmiformis]